MCDGDIEECIFIFIFLQRLSETGEKILEPIASLVQPAYRSDHP